MQKVFGRWVMALVVVSFGCDGGGGGVDSGAGGDAQVLADAGLLDDASVLADAGDASVEVDGGTACSPTCGVGLGCLRGACVATCGADLAAIDLALAAGLTPIAHACRAISGPLDVVLGGGSALPRVYDLAAVTVGVGTTFTLSSWTLDPAVSTPSVTTVATTTHDVGAGVMVYAGGYLAVSPDEASALFGYTTTELGVVGGIFDVEVGDGTASEVAAAGNFDAEWLDPTSWLVNGLGLEDAGGASQGLYFHDGAGASRQVVDEMGTYSGSLAVLDDVIIAGATAGFGTTWPDGSEGGRVFVLDRAAVVGATVISAWVEGALDGPSVFEPISGMRLASTAYDEIGVSGLEARALTEGATGWALGEPEPITVGSMFRSVYDGGDGLLVLVHAGGVMLVRE